MRCGVHDGGMRAGVVLVGCARVRGVWCWLSARGCEMWSGGVLVWSGGVRAGVGLVECARM